jgi:hypothetical protein
MTKLSEVDIEMNIPSSCSQPKQGQMVIFASLHCAVCTRGARGAQGARKILLLCINVISHLKVAHENRKWALLDDLFTPPFSRQKADG